MLAEAGTAEGTAVVQLPSSTSPQLAVMPVLILQAGFASFAGSMCSGAFSQEGS